MTTTTIEDQAATTWEGKARRAGVPGGFDPDQPRDRKGKWIETGAEVSIWGGGKGTVARNLGDGRLEVHTTDGRRLAVRRNMLEVTRNPDGSKPGDGGKKPKPSRVEKPSAGVEEFTPPGRDSRTPVADLEPGRPVLVYGVDDTGAPARAVGWVRSVDAGGDGHTVTLDVGGGTTRTVHVGPDGVARPLPEDALDRLMRAEADGDPDADRIAAEVLSGIVAADDREAGIPDAPGGGGPVTRRSDRPLKPNVWGASTGREGEVAYHADGAIGQAVNAMGDDAHLDVDGDALANVIGVLATDATVGRISSQEMLDRVKAIRDRLPEGGRARRALDGAIARLDTPDGGPGVDVPDGTPAPLRQLAADLNAIPAVRRDPDREMEPLGEILEQAAQGRLSPARMVRAVRGLRNQRHESEEGKIEIDRAVDKATREIEALARSNPAALRPGYREPDAPTAPAARTPDAPVAPSAPAAPREGERVRLGNGAEGTVAATRDDGALAVQLDSGGRVSTSAADVTPATGEPPARPKRAPRPDAAERAAVMRSLKDAGDAVAAGDADAAEQHLRRSVELADGINYSRTQQTLLARRRDALTADIARLRTRADRPEGAPGEGDRVELANGAPGTVESIRGGDGAATVRLDSGSRVNANVSSLRLVERGQGDPEPGPAPDAKPVAPGTVPLADLRAGDKVTFDVPVTASNAARFDGPNVKRPPEPGDTVTVRGTLADAPEQDMFGGYTVRFRPDGARWESARGGIGPLPRDGLEHALEDGHAVHRVGRDDGSRRPRQQQEAEAQQVGLFSDMGTDESGTPDMFMDDDASQPAPAARPAPTPPAPERVGSLTPEQVQARIRDAYSELALRQNAWVSLTSLRKLLDGIPREEQDAALRRMIGDADVTLIPEANQKTLTPEDRAAAVHVGGQNKHQIMIWDAPVRGGQPRREPEPDRPAPTPTPEPARPPAAPAPAPTPEPAGREPLADGLTYLDQVKPGDWLDEDGTPKRVASVDAAPGGDVRVTYDGGESFELPPDTAVARVDPQAAFDAMWSARTDPPDGQVHADQVKVGDTVMVAPPTLLPGSARRLTPGGTYMGPGEVPSREPVARTVTGVQPSGDYVRLTFDDGTSRRMWGGDLLARGEPVDTADPAGARGQWVSKNNVQPGDWVGFPASGPTLPTAISRNADRYGISRNEPLTVRGRVLPHQVGGSGDFDDVTLVRQDGTVVPVGGPIWASRPDRVIRYEPGQDLAPADPEPIPPVTPADLTTGDRLAGVDGVVDGPAGDVVPGPDGTDVAFVPVRRDDDSRQVVGLPVDRPVTLGGPPEETRVDDTAPEALAAGEWILDDDGTPLRVASAPAVDGDRVRFDAAPDGGPATEMTVDRGTTVTRAIPPGGAPATDTVDVPAPAPERVGVADLPDGATAGKVRLRTEQRQRILDLDLDAAGSGTPEDVAQAAARLRARQVLSAEQIRALSDHLRTLAADDSLPGGRRRAHQRAAAWLDASYARLSGFPEPPHDPGRDAPVKSYARNLTMGDVIALPGAEGQASFGTITAVRPIKGFGLVNAHVRRDDGSVEQWVLPDGVDLWVMPDLPPDRAIPADRPALRDGARLAQVEADQADAAAARAHTTALADLETGTYRDAATGVERVLAGLGLLMPNATRDQVVTATRQAINGAAEDGPGRTAGTIADLLGGQDLADQVRPVTDAVRRRALDNMVRAVEQADLLPGESWPDAMNRILAEYRDRPPSPGIGTAGRSLARLSDRLRGTDRTPDRPQARPSTGDLDQRLADYRAQLPDNLADLGRQQVERATFGPATLDDLEAGRVPDVTRTTTWADDIADDDGPGVEAMRHLSVIRAAGRDVDDRYQQHVRDRETVLRAELDEVARRRGEAWQTVSYADQLVVDARRAGQDETAIADLAARRDAAGREWQQLAARHAELEQSLATARRDALIATLSEIRPVGGQGLDYVDGRGRTLTDRGVNVAALRYAEQVLPADWLAAAREAGPVEVGGGPARHTRYGDGRPARITLPSDRDTQVAVRDGRPMRVDVPSTQPGGVPRAGAATHELAHHMEHTIPGLKQAEKLMLWDRTSSGPVGERDRPDPVTGTDRGREFVAYPGDLPNAYTGRVYGDGDAYEVWSTVMESLAGGRDDADDDLRHWGLGVLAMLGTSPDGPTGGTGPRDVTPGDPLDGVDLGRLRADRLADLEARVTDPDVARRLRAKREARETLPDGWDPASASDEELMRVLSDRWARYGDDPAATALLDRVTAELDARDAARTASPDTPGGPARPDAPDADAPDRPGGLSESSLATMESDDLATVLERNWNRYDTDPSVTALLDQVMAELDARDADRRSRDADRPDPLASVNVRDMPEEDLQALWQTHKDHYNTNPGSRDLVDRIFAELDERDRRDTDNSAGRTVQSPEDAQIDDLLARGWSYEDAYAEVHGLDAEQLRAEQRRAAVDAERAPGERREQTVRRMYRQWAHEQHLRAEREIQGGVLLSRAGRAAGVDPATLWGGNRARANKYASEELKRWWAEQPGGGRMTYAEWRAQWLGSRQDQQQARERRQASTGRDFGI